MSRLVIALFLSLCSQCSGQANQLTYRGTLEQLERNGASTPVKEFEIQCYVGVLDTEQAFYTLGESTTSLPWIEQFGQVSSNETILSNSGINIGYRHLDRNYVIPVGAPFFSVYEELQTDYEWQNSDGSFAVSGEKTVNGFDCWQVKATIGIARHHEFFVRKSQPIIESGTQTVFMGPGDRFRLKYERIPSEEKLELDEKLNQAIELLAKIKTDMNRDENNLYALVQPEQVKSIESLLPALSDLAESTALENFVNGISKEIRLSLNRNSRIEVLAESMLGQQVPNFHLETLAGEEISSETFSGNTVILHFWDYANPTLEQPYGQVGYLDFITNRWADKNVVCYGVAVNSLLSDPETKAKAIREIQKLKNFMKLGYEIGIDSGSVLNSLGNPTRLGEDLPLWVVISPEGKIAHYKTGYYEVDNRVGLREIHDLLESFHETSSQ